MRCNAHLASAHWQVMTENFAAIYDSLSQTTRYQLDVLASHTPESVRQRARDAVQLEIDHIIAQDASLDGQVKALSDAIFAATYFDLVGKIRGWDIETYGILTKPWRKVIGRVAADEPAMEFAADQPLPIWGW